MYRINSGGLSANLLKQLELAKKEIEKICSYAPEMGGGWEGIAKAYYLRYLARNAVRFKEGSMAVNLVHRALTAHWRIIPEEPRRTLMTLAAAYLLWLLPQGLYCQIEAFASKIIGAIQKRRIIQDRFRQLLYYQDKNT